MKSFWPSWNRPSSALRGRRNHASSQLTRGVPGGGLRTDMVRIRDAFRVEALEPRVLLSADPLFAPLKTFFLSEDRAIQDLLAEATHSITGTSALASADVLQSLLNRVHAEPVGLRASPAVDAYVALAAGTSSASAVILEGDWRAP